MSLDLYLDLHLILVQTSEFLFTRKYHSRMSNLSFLRFQHGFSRKPSNSIKQTQFGITRETQKSSVARIFRPKVEETRSVFDKFDTNRDGKISQDEYKAAMRVMGGKTTETEMAKAFNAADSDGDGFIDFEEFVKVQNTEGGVKTTDIRSAFKVFDVDGNGKISAEELFEVLRRIGERSSLEACRKMVRGVDADGDGLIDMDEFMIMMTRTMNLS